MYSDEEMRLLKSLSTPLKVQLFLDAMAINFEKDGDTCSSPRVAIRRKSAHCIEAALIAAAALEFNGHKCYLMDLRANSKDYDHVVCLFKRKGKWGAISKSNHAALRYREPVYASPREIAMSCFHEYINDFGDKTMRSFSVPVPTSSFRKGWQVWEKELWSVERAIDNSRHIEVVPRGLRLRKADAIETQAGKLTEWSGKSGRRVKYK